MEAACFSKTLGYTNKAVLHNSLVHSLKAIEVYKIAGKTFRNYVYCTGLYLSILVYIRNKKAYN
jgi:hypothetical protein